MAGRKIWAGEAVDLPNGYFNCIWQGDANDGIVMSFALAAIPPLRLNLTGPEVLVRAVAAHLGDSMGRSVKFNGTGSAGPAQQPGLRLSVARPAVHSTGGGAGAGPPTGHVAGLLNKPTHFEARNGKIPGRL